MNSTRKRLRITENDGKTMEDNNGTDSDGIDRISNLPTEILCHILSFMPTKFAVGTSVLSTKWKNLFRLIPNLKIRLDDSFLLHPNTPPTTYLISFKNFVNRLLNVTLRDVPSLELLCLVCQKFNDGQEISKWIRSAANLKFKKIDIRLRRLRNPNFVLNSLYGSNISSLNLMLDFAQNAPACRFNLPKLKMLSLQCMKFKHVNVLLASCPVLEFLALNNCYCQPGEKLGISVPTLRALKLIGGVYSLEGQFEIDAPKLEYISHDGLLAGGYSATRMKSLRIARFDVDGNFIQYPFESDEKAVELVRVCADAEKYWMSEKFVEILQDYPHQLPWFGKMTSLAIRYIDFNGWELIGRVLECAPKLNKLSFKSGFDDESYEIFKATLKEPMSFCMSREGETGVILTIQRNVGTSRLSLPGCSGAVHS